MNYILQNKKVYFEYNILEKYVAGIQLTGTEVKSIRNSKVSISEAHCSIINDEIFIIGMNVSHYENIKHTNHEPNRNRKLLLKRLEINKLHKLVKEKGLTIVPISVFLSDSGYIKVEIGLVRGKKLYDKREAIKERDLKKDLRKI
jgi:SsrA-binding protein